MSPPIRSFVELLRGLGLDPDEESLGDVLWLAARMGSDTAGRAEPPTGPPAGEPPPPTPRPESGREPADPPRPMPAAERPMADLRLPGTGAPSAAGGAPGRSAPSRPAAVTGADPVRLPSKVGLHDALQLARVLRPLKRKRASRRESVLDEEATAVRMAEERLRVPVFRPARRRWLDLMLVVDAHESMAIWHGLADELSLLLARVGAFRDVQVWMLDHPESAPERVGVRRRSRDASLRRPEELLAPAGQRAVLVFSDCVGPAWHASAAQRALALWGRRGPVAILQPLPQRMWEYTAAPPYRTRLRARLPGVPNARLGSRPPGSPPPEAGPPGPDGGAAVSLPIPVLELQPEWLASWASLVTGSGAAGVACMAISARAGDDAPDAAETPPVVPADAGRERPLTAAQRVHRFRATAAPDSVRLATYLAAAPISLPVIRLVQEVMLRPRRRSQLAEIFLGGLLRRVGPDDATDPDAVQYEFHDGVRDLLLDRLRAPEALRVIREVSDHLAVRFGQSRDFSAVLAGPAVAGELVVDAESRPFAIVTEQVLRRLGGRYARAADTLADAIGRGGPPTAPAAAGTGTTAGRATSAGSAGGPPAAGAGVSGEEPPVAAGRRASAAPPRPRHPLVCPYCYADFPERDIEFRCTGEQTRTATACPPRRDEALWRARGYAAPLPPVFTVDGTPDVAPCPDCRIPTRTKVCPACHSRLPPRFGKVRSRLIALVGPSDVGKTAFMTVLVHELRNDVGELFNAAIRGADDETRQRFTSEYEWPLYQEHRLFKPTRTVARHGHAPLVFRFFTQRRGLRRRPQETLFSFLDTAGEDLGSLDKLELLTRYLTNADGVVIVLDPLRLRFAPGRDGSAYGAPAPSYGKQTQDPLSALERLTDILREEEPGPVDKPVAVVFSKIDTLWHDLPDGSPLRPPQRMRPYFDNGDSKRVHASVCDLLPRLGGDGIKALMERNYLHWRFFGVSSLGASPTVNNRVAQGGIEPFRVTDPFMWLMSGFGVVSWREG